MRFWRNTNVATLSSGGRAMLPDGTLGYEWDFDLDNGSRPAGMVRISTTTVNNRASPPGLWQQLWHRDCHSPPYPVPTRQWGARLWGGHDLVVLGLRC